MPLQTTALRYFEMVARLGSITAAAERLHVAPSAISRQIAKLEEELSCVLFERRPRGMALSQAGELLAEHAKRALLGADQVTAEIRELQDVTRGLIRIASSEGFALDLLPTAILEFHKEHPGIRFELTVGLPEQITRLVINGDVDLGIVFPSVPTIAVNTIFQTDVPIMIIASPAHPLAKKRAIGLTDLKAYPLLLTRSTTSIFEEACFHEDIFIEPAFTSNTVASLIPYIKEGQGLAPMAPLSITSQLRDRSLIALNLKSSHSLTRSLQIQVMKDRKLPRACTVFLDRLKILIGSIQGRDRKPG